MSDTFAYWRNALCGSFGPVHENDPQPGYYRTRTRTGRDGRALPVAIWTEADGTIRAIRDGVEVEPSMVWTWCCMNPVAYETYVTVAEKGGRWPEDVPTLAEAAAGAARVMDGDGVGAGAVAAVAGDTGVAVGLGHNSAGVVVDRALELKATIDGLWLQASDWLGSIGPVTSQLDADRCANFAERFAELEKTAEEARTGEKKPILEQGRTIDAKWKPVIGAAEEAKRAMKKALEPYLLAETQRLQAQAGFGGLPDSVKAGTNGRRVSLRRTRRVSVSDRNAFIAHYRRDARVWQDEAVQKVLLRLAEADLAAGQRVPGAAMIEEQVAA